MQKLFTASQIRAWDNYTIKNEPISSINLMERASISFVDWFVKKYHLKQNIYIFCGPGNNGGDGLAVSRLLQDKGYQVSPFLINPNNSLSRDCNANFKLLNNVVCLTEAIQISPSKDDVIIDALFGSGLTRPVTGINATLIEQLNMYNCIKIAIDIPSGMYCDIVNSSKDIIFKTDIAISFQIPKRAFFYTENKSYIKSFEVVEIGLSRDYYNQTDCNWYYSKLISNINIQLNSIPYKTNNIENNTLDIIKKIQKKAFQQQMNLILKREFTYIITSKGIIYITNEYN